MILSDQPMKIVHAVYSLEMGGAEVLVAQLCRIQRAEGHDVSVCAYSTLGSVGEALRAEGFEVRVLGEAPPARTILRYLQLFRRLRPDVVHCHNPAPTLQAAIGGRLAGAKRVLSTRHSLVAPPYDMAAERKFNLVASFCDWIVGICEITCENLRGTPLAPKKKIVRVYNGVPPMERVPQSSLNRSGFTIVFIGRLAPVKDLGTLIRAVALAAQRVPDLKLWVVGDGPSRSELKSLTRELGAGEHVQFHGQQMETAAFYSAADLFAMSSISEGLPMSLLQAMSLGLPAVATDIGGLAEVIRLAQCGLLSPTGDSQAMADNIVRLAEDAELRTQCSQHAIEAYKAQFTLEQMNAGYMKLYRGN